jgi:hypothetical protein
MSQGYAYKCDNVKKCNTFAESVMGAVAPLGWITILGPIEIIKEVSREHELGSFNFCSIDCLLSFSRLHLNSWWYTTIYRNAFDYFA